MVCCTDLFSKRISFRLHSTKQVYAQKEDCFFRLLSDERTASAFIRLAFRALTLASVSEMDSFAFCRKYDEFSLEDAALGAVVDVEK